MVEERPESAEVLLLAAGAAIAVGAIVVVLAGSAGHPSVGPIGLHRIGQALFVAGFALGGGYHYVLGHGLQAAGFGCLAVAWGLLFVDWLLEPLLSGAYIPLLVAVLALGAALVVLGIFGDAQRLREIVPTERVTGR
ncbi:hypothetical protein BV210_12525 [Halorientalis sp. IM1011]|uniref:hypothetical protein n=1 Tax=Halorientalis sp. IM1011 TaxID=1932360 RepID=UPI00097CC6CB|nr:hypothetical protein [Halorientalis sp. IM1011]AQL43465.1 hypothetical protein BV210_12525 [Halorientalis sp. IM1011]